MNEHQKLAIQALQNMKGDDLYRAQLTFKGKTPEQMREQYGQSGKTCQMILNDYQEHNNKCDAAIAWIVQQKP